MNFSFDKKILNLISDLILVFQDNRLQFINEQARFLLSKDDIHKITTEINSESPFLAPAYLKKENRFFETHWSISIPENTNIRFIIGSLKPVCWQEELKSKLFPLIQNILSEDTFDSIFHHMLQIFLDQFNFSACLILMEHNKTLIKPVLIEKDSIQPLPQKEAHIIQKILKKNLKNEYGEYPFSRTENDYLLEEALYYLQGKSRNPIQKIFFQRISLENPVTIFYFTHHDNRILSLSRIKDFYEILKLYLFYLDAVFKAKKTEQVKADFLAVLNHELRTPLNGILGYAQLMEETLENEEDRENVSYIIQSGKKLLQIFENLLLFQELRFQQYALKKEIFNLDQIKKTIQQEFLPKARQKGILLNIRHSKIPSLYISDPYLIHFLSYNLIDNALKFTSSGKVEVYFDHNARTQCLKISVSDTGPGFPAHQKKKITAQFQQLDPTMNRSYEGLGLGLTIVKEILSLFQGKLEIESEIGSGTMIKASFPAEAIPKK